ncbi:penicillin-binding protein 1A [Ramlibacter sp. Leaf400]|uniref:penicillin-binding protein 1A n=1 Tax=Ramlibacter sp. Leaf400 TaxID=1736365 RepID=UPI0006FA8980|nr:penicillin-binding protein 1A [Ramlibacter sp. Leaf400]KQT09459.1 penicillin-binding protein [Ramlibacter sp. Leaf400]
MSKDSPPDDRPASRSRSSSKPTVKKRLLTALLWLAGGVLAAGLSMVIVGAVALSVAYPNLPDISELSDYRPKLPLRVFSADNVLIGEFGEERRNLTPIAEIPAVMKNAVLAIEDARFYSHSGVDYRGLLRAAIANLGRAKSQGASTITMQVARNVYLSSEKTFTRKLYEVLLTFKLEHLLTKDQILEIYMNQIFLGNRAYGFAAASEIYYGKAMKDITIAEAAMLAGLPQAPSANNPVSNPKRARSRQLYIIERMEENGFITAEQADSAKKQELKLRTGGFDVATHSAYVAETVRQLVYAQYGAETYTRGLNVVTTVKAAQQEVAYRSLRKGIMDYERRQIYRGPEQFVDLPADRKEREDAIDDALADHPDNGDVMAAVVLEAGPKRIVAVRGNGEPFEIIGEGLRPAQSGLSDKAPPKIKIRPGAVIRVVRTPKNTWEITQLPEVEGAFIAINPKDGAIQAMVGGFDFHKNKFNHATQAWRQPGSGFKPFIYSAALEKGFTPSTIVNDAPLFFDAGVTGGQPWEPKNYDGKFEGPMPLHTALAKSKNMVSIRILQAVGTQNAQDWVGRFGFEPEKHPPYLTMALGAGSVTPLQMATGYSVFANGGYRVNPWVISRITDHRGKVLVETQPPLPTEAVRAIDARNAFIMNRLLQEIARSGTAARAQATLKRSDLYGKTGTTNDSIDTWFNGFHPSLVAVVWMGYDNPRPLGDRETGGSMSLPVWINFMESALKGVPEVAPVAPPGVVNVGGEWYYEEYARGGGVSSLGVTAIPGEPVSAGGAEIQAPRGSAGQGTPGAPGDRSLLNADGQPPAPQPRQPDERRSILDLFRN